MNQYSGEINIIKTITLSEWVKMTLFIVGYCMIYSGGIVFAITIIPANLGVGIVDFIWPMGAFIFLLIGILAFKYSLAIKPNTGN